MLLVIVTVGDTGSGSGSGNGCSNGNGGCRGGGSNINSINIINNIKID